MRLDAFTGRPLNLAAILLLAALLLTSARNLHAQVVRREPDLTIDAARRTKVIEGVLKQLNESYVYLDVARRMEKAVRERLQRKEYEQITSAAALASALTEHLQAVSHDKHLRVGYSYESLPRPPGNSADNIAGPIRRRMSSDANDFGLAKVEILSGNIGYLDIREFQDGAIAGEAFVAAMKKMADTDALIIDLRSCRGGSPTTVKLLSSYLFDKPVHLTTYYSRPDNNRGSEVWTLRELPGGRRYINKDVYILTSNATASAGESITYSLKNLKRVTVIGETTRGAAHQVRPQQIDEHFWVMVPITHSINPVTKTDWEGTGVQPDFKVPAAAALRTAQLAALKKLATTSVNVDRKNELKSLIERLEEKPNASVSRAKPDFSGTWVLDKSKSDGLPPDVEMTMMVMQTGESKIDVALQIITPQGEENQQSSYILDGKEMQVRLPGPNGTSAMGQQLAYWINGGSVVEIVDEGTFATSQGARTIKSTRQWQLSPDGQILTIDLSRQGPGLFMQSKRVFTKRQK